MTDKFKPGDAVGTTRRMTLMDLSIPVGAVGWIVGLVPKTYDVWKVRFAIYPDHPDGRPWQVLGEKLTRLKTGDGADA